jgi:hypothetical protein
VASALATATLFPDEKGRATRRLTDAPSHAPTPSRSMKFERWRWGDGARWRGVEGTPPALTTNEALARVSPRSALLPAQHRPATPQLRPPRDSRLIAPPPRPSPSRRSPRAALPQTSRAGICKWSLHRLDAGPMSERPMHWLISSGAKSISSTLRWPLKCRPLKWSCQQRKESTFASQRPPRAALFKSEHYGPYRLGL